MNFKEMRQRKGLQQEQLLDIISEYSPVINRLERGELLPRPDATNYIMDKLGAQVKEVIYPHLGEQSIEVYALRGRLIQALDNKDLPEAQAVYDKISGLIDLGIPESRQFFLSQKARLLEMQGAPSNEIMPLVQKGIKETYDDFNESSPGEKVLILEEPELFHTLARLHIRNGDLPAAARILEETMHGLQRLPTGERERDRRIIPIILSLVDCRQKTGAYEDALKTCDMGLNISAMRSNGQGTPELLLHKAAAWLSLGRGKEEAARLIRMGFAGHMTLGEKELAMDALGKAKKDYGITFETYGMENLDIPPRKWMPYARGKVPPHNSIGEMIKILREEKKITITDLCRGICSISNLHKIENGDVHGHVHYVEPLMQRLGRDPMMYFNFFLLRRDFEAHELKDLIRLLLIFRKHDEAAAALEKLKTYKAYKKGANLQFVRRVEAALFVAAYKYTHPEVEKMLLEALRLTCPQFEEKDISGYHLTLDESVIINMLASHYMEKKELKRAAKIYEALLDNLNRRYVDEQEKARMYPTVMFNLTTCQGRLNRRDEAMETIKVADEFSRSRGRLDSLPSLMANKAYNLYMKGDKEKSLPYLALAYYGFEIFKDYGRAVSMTTWQEQAKELFGIEFD